MEVTMMQFTTIFAALALAKEWIEFIRSGSSVKNEKYERALEAVWEALNETKIYIGSIERRMANPDHSPTDPERARKDEAEAQLSRLWKNAALKIRHYDPDLASRLTRKADYWANPDKWSAADVIRARITIDEVDNEATLLMSTN
jgi:hypothetical protein